MTIYVQEQEMISRLSDSLKRAASRAKEITEAEETKKAEIFIDFIDNIKIAAGSSHQLAHAQENPYWLPSRPYWGYGLPYSAKHLVVINRSV
jgi:hypothetical protein